MKKLMTIVLYLFGVLILIVGSLTLILEEPIYGIGLIIIGVITIPITSKLIDKISPNKFSPKVKPSLAILIGIAIITSVNMFGKEVFDKTEKLSPNAISDLSKHTIKSIKINRLDYYYIEKGLGEAVILLHGFPDMANTWDETITELSKTNRVIAPFMRGYYPTGIPEDMDFSVKTIADDIVKLANHLNIDRFKIIGQDWGASITFAVANLVPDRVEKIVSIAIPHPTCLAPTPKLLYNARHFFLFGTGNYGVRYTRKNDFEYIDRLYQRWSPDYTDYKESSEAIKATFRLPGRLEAALGYYMSFAADQKLKDVLSFYQTLPKVPVLFTVGENDAIATEAILEAMRAKMPNGSKTVLFKNSGHFLHKEIFKEFISEVKLFFNH